LKFANFTDTVFIIMALTPEELKIPFVNLRTFSHYSMLLAVGTPEEHLKAAKAAGHSGVAIADNVSMAGSIQLHKLAKDNNFPCVIGAHLYVTEDLNVRDPDHKYDRLLVFVQSWQGYQNLCQLVTAASLEDHLYYRPRVSFEELFKFKEGLIISTSDASSPFGHSILNADGRERELLQLFKKEFGENLYCEISLADQGHRWNKDLRAFVPEDNKQEIVNKRMLELAKELGVVSYLTMPSYMPRKDQYMIQKIVISNSPTGKDGWHFHEPQYTMSLPELYARKEMIAPYISDELFTELCKNSVQVLEKAQDFKPIFKPLLLKIDYAEHALNKDPELEKKMLLMEKYFSKVDPDFAEMLALTRENKKIQLASKLFPELADKLEEFTKDDALRLSLKVIFDLKKVDLLDETSRKRITREFKVIQRNGVFRFCDYFLPLEDVVRFHRENGYERGFGRGSGGSSIICYGMDISDVDPIPYVLDFDRFVTLERLGRFNTEIAGIPKASIKKTP
jgi:DNA polymerase III alpha subunit